MTRRKILLFVMVGIATLAVIAVAGYFVVQQSIKGQIEDGLRQLAANPPAPYRSVAYDKVEFSLHDRRVVVTGLRAEPGAGGESISIGKLELESLDIDVWQSALGTKAVDPKSSQNFRRLFDKAAFTDISAVRSGQPVKSDRLTIVNLDLRPIPPEAVATLRTLSTTERVRELLAYVRIESVVMEGVQGMSGGGALTFDRGEVVGLRDGRFGLLAFDSLGHDQRDGRLTLARFELRDGLSAVWFSPVETKTLEEKLSYVDFSAMKLSGLRKNGMAAGGGSAAIELAEFGAVNRKKVDSIVLRGVNIVDQSAANPIALSIANGELRDLDWEEILPILAPLLAADAGPDALRTQLEKIGRLRYSLGKLAFTGMDFGPGITLAEASLRFQNDSRKGDADIAFSELTIKAAEMHDKQMAAGLIGFGYNTLTMSLRMRASGDYEASTVALDALEIFGPQVGKLVASYAVSNYKQPAPDQTDPMAVLLAANIDKVEISWQDDGLTQRTLAATARQQRTSVTNVKAMLAAQLRQFAQPYQNSPRIRALGDALLGYLDRPGALTIAAKPAKPVPVTEIIGLLEVSGEPDLPALFDLLEIETSAR